MTANLPPFSGIQPVAQWLQDFTNAAHPKQPSVHQAFQHGLAENVLTILGDVEKRLGNKWRWTGRSLLVALHGIQGELEAARHAREQQFKKLAITSACVAGAAFVAPALLVGGLGLVGFSAVGPVAGSMAAFIQSTVYGGAVASGSAFALAQSIAMGGAALGAVETAAAAVGITATAAAGGAVAATNTSETHNEWPPDFVVSEALLAEIQVAV